MESLGNRIWGTAQSFSAAMEHAQSESGIAGMFSSDKITAQPLRKNSKSETSTELPGNNETSNTNKETTSSTYADKFMERIISMAIPTTTTSSKRELDRVTNRIEMQKSRPQLSMQVMSKNSILLLQRLSIPFESIDTVLKFINWENPSITITVMLFISLCILKPINFLTVPLFYICFEIIIPAYMVQNPNIDESVDGWENELPKPVNEFSREFLLNVTDLQNHMLLYVHMWNFINAWCWKLFYFKDEILTWFIFVSLLSVGIFLQVFGMSIITMFFPYIKLLIVILSWCAIIALHPSNRSAVLERFFSEELRLKTMSTLNYYEAKLIKELDLNSSKMEIRQLEVFELQVFSEETKTWQFACYSNDLHPPNSHIRLNNLPIEGTLLLDSINAPDGWKFVNNNKFTESNNRFNTETEVKLNADLKATEKDKSKKHLIFDHEKNKILKQKRRHMKRAKKLNKKQRRHSQDILINRHSESVKSKLSIEKRKQSNDFNNVLLDPLILDKYLVEQMDTGIQHDGWYMDLCPSKWVNDNYLIDVLEVDEDTKWVYDLVIMGNGVSAYSAGLGVTNGKLRRHRGDVRRRRWTRYVVREIVKGVHSDILQSKEEEAIETSEESEYTETDSDYTTGSSSEEYEHDEESDEDEDDEVEEEDDIICEHRSGAGVEPPV